MEGLVTKAFIDGGAVLGAFIVIAIFFLIILKHFLKQNELILQMAIEQNEKWQKVIDEHTAQAREFHNRSAEADKFQREEHKSMIEQMQQMTAKFLEEHRKREKESSNICAALETICDKVADCDKPGK
jgi:hypothetical protein